MGIDGGVVDTGDRVVISLLPIYASEGVGSR